jgi:serine/threonine-protein kinase HipA
MNNNANLEVYIHEKKVGNLAFENDEYIYNYQNEDDTNNYISLTMPLRQKNYINRSLHPIFEMHLPEGYLLSIIKKHFSKITKTDDFGLLKLMSTNIKGRVNYKINDLLEKNELKLENLLHPKSELLFDELVNKFALSSVLSGVQPKVIARVQDKATLSLDEYIVKSWGEDYKHLALNEFYCMEIARKSNIAVPEFYISDDHKLFIMKRFDITKDKQYLGFEDMCVLQAKQRDDKYNGSYEKIAKTIKIFTSKKNKKSSLKQLFKMIVINHFVKNGDAHLKNFALLYKDINDISISPAFDIVCTTLYIKNDIPALHLLGSKKWWDKKYLIRFAMESCDLTLKESNELYMECTKALNEVIKDIQEKILTLKTKEEKEFLNDLLKVLEENTKVT